MGRVLKWAAGIVAGLIIILLIAVYFILSSYDFNDLKPQIAKAALEATGRELTIGGDIDLEIGLTPTLVLTDIKFQNAPWGTRPEMVKLKRFEVQVAILPLLRGNIEIRRFIVVEPDILIETDESGKLNVVFEMPEKAPKQETIEQPAEDITTTLPSLTFNKLEIEKGKIAYRDGKSGKTSNVNLNRFSANTTGMDSPMNFSLNGDFDDALFDLNGILGPVTALIDPEKVWPLKITANAFSATINLDGSIKDALAQSGIDMGFIVQVQDWTELSEFIGQPIPIKESLEIGGRAGDTGPKAYKLSDLKISVGSNSLEGFLGISLAEEIPYLDVTLSSESLDLRPFLSGNGGKKTSEAKQDKSEEKSKKLFPDDPLPLDALKQINGTFKTRIGKIILPQLVLENLAVDTIIKEGQLDVEPLQATIGKGSLNGSVSLKSKVNSAYMALVLKIENFGLGDMLKDLGITDLLEGDIDVDVNLAGEGASVASIMAGLNGHESVIMSQGRVNNKYIDLLGGDISTSLFRLVNPVTEKKDYTEIRCLVNRFDIKKGIADSTVLLVDTSSMSVVGEGKIDLKTEKLDIALKPFPKEGIAGFSLSLGELAKPFKLSGTLAKPSLGIDPGQAAILLGKAIGGAAVFGTVGLASALVGKSQDEDVGDPCLSAIEIARTGVVPSKSEKSVEKGSEPKTQDKIKGVIEGVGKSLKGLFGR
ncbi:AsmA family protein [Deltaproteobacteria bacterium]|nr:AsmA family protein [Deltaproteobacteria bacterium]